MRERKTWVRMIVVVFCVGLLIAGSQASEAAAAEETHVFNATLSLTGGCGTSALDPVPDPAEPPCPGTVPECPTEPVGSHPPSGCFNNPAGVATDAYGNIYVAVSGPEASLGDEGRIDVFDSSGHFITELKDENGPGAMVIDSEGNLYVVNRFQEHSEQVQLYEPSVYKPEEGEIEYGKAPAVLVAKAELGGSGISIDRTNDHVFVALFENSERRVNVYKSAAEGNEFIESFNEDSPGQMDGLGVAVDAAHNRVYLSVEESGEVINAVELAPPHTLLFQIKSSALPAGSFIGNLSVAVDEGTGHSFAYDGPAKKVYEFDQSGKYVQTIQHGFQQIAFGQITVDNGELSPNGALNPEERFLYVPSNPGGVGHSYAFGPSFEGPPSVESVSFANVGEEEAELQASIEPFGLPTHYTFQYTTQAAFEESGFTGALTAGEGDIPAGNSPIAVSAAATGLAPGTAYRFRVVATNEEGADEGEAAFATYPAAAASPPCPNDAFRTGFSALLPDCRAYELVTPPDTNARTPFGVGHLGTFFAAPQASPQGSAVSFFIEGGTIPGAEAVGSLAGDPYLSSRGENGWGTSYTGPNGEEARGVVAGSTSSDQGYYFWKVALGSAAIEEKETNYVQYPDGHASLIGRGSLAVDPQAQGLRIGPNGGHIVFTSPTLGSRPAVQLEPNAPPGGTEAIYDRTSDEITHVISLLPGDETPGAGEDAKYVGASLDARGIAFTIGNKLYLRHDDEETYELGEKVTFAGIAEGGSRAFYVKGGNLFRFDAGDESTTPFTAAGNVIPVNVSADGSTAYFVSPSVLTSEPNPRGAKPQAGEENLYRSQEGAISFLGTVTNRDVVGAGANERVGGLGLWTTLLGSYTSAAEGRLGAEPSRTTPNGNVLLFESRAELTGFDSGEQAQIFRYDAAANSLDCLSCSPTLSPASGDASLESTSQGFGEEEPFSSYAYVENLSADGKRAVFQSPDALVPGDTDERQDVYEWEADGVGTCERPGGCIELISSGHSADTNYLFAVSDEGNDVFFRTGDLLLPRDSEETPSIYDARVGGGFPEPLEAACEGEGCKGALSSAPSFPAPASAAGGPSGNVAKEKGCPKGKRKARRHGKVVCVKKHRKHPRHHKSAGTSGGAGK